MPIAEKDFTVMSYNVRLFNLFKWIDDNNVGNDILSFVNEKNPDIICIQEYSENAHIDLRIYKYKAVFIEGDKIKTGQAIFSKFPIINKGNLHLLQDGNNIIFADIKKGKDTLRVYNMHLQSIKISPDINDISNNVEIINKETIKYFERTSAYSLIQDSSDAEMYSDKMEIWNLEQKNDKFKNTKWNRFLAKTIYNPSFEVTLFWKKIGTYKLTELKAKIKN